MGSNLKTALPDLMKANPHRKRVHSACSSLAPMPFPVSRTHMASIPYTSLITLLTHLLLTTVGRIALSPGPTRLRDSIGGCRGCLDKWIVIWEPYPES